MLTNYKLSRISKFQMGQTKKEETLEEIEATGKNCEKSFLELPRTLSGSQKLPYNAEKKLFQSQYCCYFDVFISFKDLL